MSTACLMAVALFIFFMGKRHYPPEEIKMSYGKIKTEKKPTTEEKQADRAVLVRLAGIFTVIIFFWAIYDQTMSTWVYFAEKYMNLYGFQPDQPQALNPWLIIIFTPLFNFMWVKFKIKKATTKMMIGYVITAVCMAIMAIAGYMAVGQKVSLLWMVVAYAVITLAELCISVVGLELAFTEAPKHMKSTVTSVFLFTVFIGDILAGFLASIYPRMNPGNYFGLLTIMMVIVAIIFYGVAKDFERKKVEIQLITTQP